MRSRLRTLSVDGPSISGEALGALPTLPPHLRGTFLSCMHVLCRINGHMAPLTDSASLATFLEERSLVEALDAEWYKDDGAGFVDAMAAPGKGGKGRELREAYVSVNARARPKRGGKR